MGETAPKIEAAISKAIANTDIVFPMYRVKDVKQAVERARKISKKGDVILFSPASASFDMFKNFEERGEKFKECVRELK